jgi:hypothetical protein
MDAREWQAAWTAVVAGTSPAHNLTFALRPCDRVRPLTRPSGFLHIARPSREVGRIFMEFMRSAPDIVRSPNQRWLLDYWNNLRGAVPLPAWDSFQANALAVPSDDLSFTRVMQTDAGPRYQIRFHGPRLGQLYGRESCVGKFLDEILPAKSSAATLETYHHLVETRCPVYTVADLRDPTGKIVHYERLLLPFTRDGSRVERIAASLEAVSPEGTFASQGLMTSTPKPPAFALCTTVHF